MLRTSFLSQRHPRIDGIWRLNSLLQQRAYASAVNFTGSQAKDEADLAIYVHWPYCERSGQLPQDNNVSSALVLMKYPIQQMHVLLVQ